MNTLMLKSCHMILEVRLFLAVGPPFGEAFEVARMISSVFQTYRPERMNSWRVKPVIWIFSMYLYASAKPELWEA